MKRNEMTARELDALIAEKVMGWRVGEHPELHGTGQMMAEYEEPVYFKTDGSFLCECQWSPSTEIAAAWEVVEKMHENGWRFDLSTNEAMTEYVGVNFGRMEDGFLVEARGMSAPEAIYNGALRAMGIDIPFGVRETGE